MGKGWKNAQTIMSEKQSAKDKKPRKKKASHKSKYVTCYTPDEREKTIRKNDQESYSDKGKQFKNTSPKKSKSKKHGT